MTIAEAFEIKNTANLSEDDLNGHIVKVKTNTEELSAFADSGSPMSFLNEKPHAALNKMINQLYSNVFYQRTPPET